MKKNRKLLIRSVALTLILAVLNSALLPTVSWALTSMDTQPEVWGYQPVDATDNVSLTSGKFNYTIPITSIPEYPMAIGYSSGPGIDQEAGMFGLGFNGFSGAIARNMMGVPDDIQGAPRRYEYQNQKRWDASLSGSFSPAAFNASFDVVGVGASISVTAGYNNYQGVYGAIGLGFGLGSKIGKSKIGPAGGLGAAFISDSRETGIRFGAGATVGLSIALPNNNGAFLPVGGYGMSTTRDKQGSRMVDGGTLLVSAGKSVFEPVYATGAAFLAPLSYVMPTQSGFGISLPVPIVPGANLTGSYSQIKTKDDFADKKAYGFMYLGSYSRNDREQMADMTIEGENSYAINARNSPSFLQRDFFMVNTMGVSGSMQLFQEEFGTVSRNYNREQFRNFEFYQVKTDRREVYPWHNVTQASINKGVDILALLKKKDRPESKDFDNVLFDEIQRVDMNDPKNRFGNAEFKMRGDLTGEYNVSSDDATDQKLNKYRFLHVEGSQKEAKYGIFSREKTIPLYYPQPARKYDKYAAGHLGKDRSTYIKKTTIGNIINALGNEADKVPGTGSSGEFKFSQSFYTHYRYKKSDPSKNSVVKLHEDMEYFNLIKDLKEKSSSGHYRNLIGSIEMQTVNGMRYFFNLPVFAKNTKSLQLAGNGFNPPVASGTDYHTFSDGTNRRKVAVDDLYMYPYAWLLTAIVGDDYIDIDDVPGPSDGDLGYWVKFRYVKACDNYRWRHPFTGLEYAPGAYHNPDDDSYAMRTGEKEIYYLAEVESANYLSKYQMMKRFDGWDASPANTQAVNTIMERDQTGNTDRTGSNSQFAVTQIDLYKKHDSGDNSAERPMASPGTRIKSTVFKYDYSQCPDVPNNYARFYPGTITRNLLDYHIGKGTPEGGGSIETGKLTLRKVQHIAYDENGNPASLPSYQFRYWGDTDGKYNPAYDKDCVDQWGNYNKNAKTAGPLNTSADYYHHYTELTKPAADENSKVYNMSGILLPSGGSMHINYQAQSYEKVQNKKAYVMRQVKDSQVSVNNSNEIILSIDVSDLEGGSLASEKILEVGKNVYGEIAFYQTDGSDEKELLISSDSAKVTFIGAPVQSGSKWYQQIRLAHIFYPSITPFVSYCKNYMYTESPQMRVIKESTCGDYSFTSKYLDMENDDLSDAVDKIASNLRSLFVSDPTYQSRYNQCYGAPATRCFTHLSFIRTNVYKGKYTGSSVSTIELRDGFKYATLADGSTGTRENNYGTRYFYDQAENGNGVSAGVATIEPGAGPANAIDMALVVGSGYAPSPAIISGKTTMENKYQADSAAAAAGDAISRPKGKSVYEFYNPSDPDLQFRQNLSSETFGSPGSASGGFFMFGIWAFFVIKLPLVGKIKFPFWFPVTVDWTRTDQYHMKSYAYTDYTDIYGRPRSITQWNSAGQQVGSQSFTYYGINEPVPVYKNGFGALSSVVKPGRMDQSWSEAYYTKEANIKLVAPLLLLLANTERHFSYTNMKYTYIPPVLKEVTSTFDGMKTVTTNTGFDYYSGTPVEVRSNDSYGSTKISRTVPAYWKYPAMGPRAVSGDVNINNLTATTGSYMYLNEVSSSSVLGVSITEWAAGNANKWRTTPGIIAERAYVDPTAYRYFYEPLKDRLAGLQYSSGGRTYDQSNSKREIARNASIFKPYRSHTYETELTSAGVFAAFTDFSYTGSNVAAWKTVSTNELFDQNGNLVETKDVLNKYASQQMGYHFSNSVSTAVNASWGGSVFEGAENTYKRKSSEFPMLEGNRVSVDDAEAVRACKNTMMSKTLSINSFYPPLPGADKFAHILTIKPPPVKVYNQAFARINLVYKHNPRISRVFYVSLNDNSEYTVVSDKGEPFTGFYVFSDGVETKLMFTTLDFDSFALDSTHPAAGFSVNLSYGRILDCNMASRSYQVPQEDCIESHTGEYSFRLKPGKNGTRYTLSFLNVKTEAEFRRKYTAMVWVYATSPLNTELVMQRTDRNGNNVGPETKTSLATPHAVAGNWRLLRLDFDNSAATYDLTNLSLNDYVHVFVRNSSAKTDAVYDDFKVMPYNAEMSSVVYDHKFNRVTAQLDKDHFAGFSSYDARGRVVESAVELQNTGKVTVQKFIYNDQRKK